MHLWRTVDPDIPCQVASPQSLTPFLRAQPLYTAARHQPPNTLGHRRHASKNPSRSRKTPPRTLQPDEPPTACRDYIQACNLVLKAPCSVNLRWACISMPGAEPRTGQRCPLFSPTASRDYINHNRDVSRQTTSLGVVEFRLPKAPGSSEVAFWPDAIEHKSGIPRNMTDCRIGVHASGAGGCGFESHRRH